MSELSFRKLSKNDTENIFHASKGNVADYFYDFNDLEEAAEWVKGAIEEQVADIKVEYVVYEGDSFIGMISPRYLKNGTVDIGMWVSINFQGKGYGKRMLSQMLEMLQSENIRTVIYEADKDNEASISLAKSLGFISKGESDTINFELKF